MRSNLVNVAASVMAIVGGVLVGFWILVTVLNMTFASGRILVMGSFSEVTPDRYEISYNWPCSTFDGTMLFYEDYHEEADFQMTVYWK